MNKIVEKILEYGQKRDTDSLLQFLDGLQGKELECMITQRLSHSNTPQVLHYVLNALSTTASGQVTRMKLTELLLGELEKRPLSNSQSNAILCRIVMELDTFPVPHLLTLTKYCIKKIQSGKAEFTSWKDLLPKLLSLLGEQSSIHTDGNVVSGAEFQSEVISSLCLADWDMAIVTSLATMFRDLQLSQDDHQKVVSKLCKCLENMDPQEVPPLVHHLLRLCENKHSFQLFSSLQTYFHTHIYSKSRNDTSENFQLMYDSDSIETSCVREAQLAEGTVLYHIDQSANLGHPIIKYLLKTLKGIVNTPEFLLQPFLFTVLLSVSCTPAFEEQVLDILKSTILRSIVENTHRQESAWIKEMVPEENDVSSTLVVIIDNCTRERDKVIKGLVNLGFALLDTSARGKSEKVAEKMWKYGNSILVSLLKKQRDVTSNVLQMLSDHIMTAGSTIQYTDCLAQLSNSVRLVILESQVIIMDLIENLMYMQGSVSENVVSAIVPVVKCSHTLKNSLILSLRKALFSRDADTRKMAVTGFLQMLKHFKVKGLLALSQSSQDDSPHSSSRSLVNVDVHSSVGGQRTNSNSNEAICLELLGVLRRCFMQQAKVKICLYEGLYEVICKNSDLCSYIVEILLKHFHEYYVTDEEVQPPLKFSSIATIQDREVVLQESLGHLLYAVQQVVTKGRSLVSEECYNLKRLESMLQSVTERMESCQLSDLDLEDENLADNSPESQKKYLIAKDILGVYEALIAYQIYSWTQSSTENGQIVIRLFKGYSRIVEFIKASTKTKKGDGGKNKKDKLDNTMRKAEGSNSQIKIPPSILEQHSLSRIILLLHCDDVSWVDPASANVVKSCREFQQYVMGTTLQFVQRARMTKSGEFKKSLFTFKFCSDVGVMLYKSCITKLLEVQTYDGLTAQYAVECFLELLTVAGTHYRSSLPKLLDAMVDVSESSGLERQLIVLIEKIEELLLDILNMDEEEEEPSKKRIPPLLISILSLLSSHLPPSGQHVKKVLEWIKKLSQEKTISNLHICKNMLSLLLTVNLQSKSSSRIMIDVALQLHHLMGDIEEREINAENASMLKIVKENTKLPSLLLVCEKVEFVIQEVDWIISRLQAEYRIMPYQMDASREEKRRNLKNRENDLCTRMIYACSVLNILTLISVPTAPCVEALLKLIIHQYNTLTNFTKYYLSYDSPTATMFTGTSFEKLVKIAGKNVSSNTYTLIHHVEQIQKEQFEEQQSKKKKRTVDPMLEKTKVLRETKHIPRVIFEVEQFEKFVIKLSNKTKVDLMKYVKLSTSRDFRLITKTMNEVFERQNQTQMSLDEEDISNTRHETQNETSQPPRKKIRTQDDE